MHAISSLSPSQIYLQEAAARASNKSTSDTSSTDSTQKSGSPSDSIQLSPLGRDTLQTGRIALNEKAGNITSDQATQLYSQIAANQKQLAADKAADGGTLNAADAQSIETAQTVSGQQIYTAAHNGAPPPTTRGPHSDSEIRNIDQAVRIGVDEKAGNLTSTQASTLDSQIQTTQQQILSDQAGNNGSLTSAEAAAINQTQSLLSTQITSLAQTTAG